jgi:hypothetical protein
VNPDQQLIDYISKNLNLGYDQQSITQTLLSSGYSQQQVNAAFDYLYAQSHYGAQQRASYSPGGHFGSKPIALYVMIGVGILLAVVSGVLLFADSSSSPSTGFEVQSPRDQPQTSLQDTPTTPVVTDDPVVENERNTQTSNTPTTPTDTQPSQTDSTQTTTTTITTPTQQATLSGGELTRLEIDQEVDKIAATKPQEALQLCAQILAQGGRSNCIIKVALESEQPSVCEELNDDFVRDTCYMNFAIEEIGSIQSVCANVQDQFKQRNCVLLFNNFAESEDAIQAQEAIEQLPLAQQEQILEESQTHDGPTLG